MRGVVCGGRGSTPAPGPEFGRYGDNTPCVAIASDDDEFPTLVLDAGTGLQRLSCLMNGQPFRGTLLLGHLHWDHTHGLPFFAAGDRADSEVTCWCRPRKTTSRACSAGPCRHPISRSGHRSSGGSGASPAWSAASTTSRGSRWSPVTSPTRVGALLASASPTVQGQASPTCPITDHWRSALAPTDWGSTTQLLASWWKGPTC